MNSIQELKNQRKVINFGERQKWPSIIKIFNGIKDDFFKYRRFAEPEEVAAAVAFLATSAASYINGVNLPVDGGRTRSL